jgi:hypothetical protein
VQREAQAQETLRLQEHPGLRCGDKIATQMGDCSEGQLAPLASPSDDKDTGCYTQRNSYTAHMNDTNHAA